MNDQERLYQLVSQRYKVRLAVLTMARDRGYATNEAAMPLDQYMAQFSTVSKRDAAGIFLEPSGHPSTYNCLATEPIIIFLNDAPGKLGLADVKPAIKTLSESTATRGILVCATEPTSKALEELNKQRPKLWFERFVHSTLLANPMLSESYYREQKCLTTKEELAELEAQFGTLANFPSILRSDPVAKHLGLRLGNVIEVRIVSESAGIYRQFLVCRQKPGADKQFDAKDGNGSKKKQQ